MRLLDVEVIARPDAVRLTGTMERERGAAPADVYFDYEVPEPSFVGAGAEALAAALLLPAMRAGETLEIVPPISPLLHFSLPRIRDIFRAWWKEFPHTQIRTTPAGADQPPRTNRMATFFSGGVDSFYSLLKHRHGADAATSPLTHVIFLRGVESRLELSQGVEASQSRAREIAAATKVQCITGQTNIRSALQGSEANLHWERRYHGSALAALALGLSPGFSHICIPSAFSYNHLVAHGSTALVDEMYSTERLRILHDGAEVTRPVKVARILEWNRELVLAHLRVCVMNSGGAYNCGRCYKCVRTAIPLRVLGAWDRAVTFPEKSIDHWERTIADDHLVLIEENLRFAREYGGDSKLIDMLTRLVRRRRRKEAALGLVNNSPLERLLPAADYVQSAIRWSRRKLKRAWE